MPFTIVQYREQHFAGVKALWAEVFPGDPPWNSPETSIPRKLKSADGLFLVALDANRVIGTIMAGYDGHRGWLYSVVVDPAARKMGIGTALVRDAEQRLEGLGCLKINLQVRSANTGILPFYEKLGYAVEERIAMGKGIGASRRP